MRKLFLAVIATCLIIGGSMIFIPWDSTWVMAITFFSVMGFTVWGNYLTYSYPYSDPDGPNRGFDPRTIESARRRADGIE